MGPFSGLTLMGMATIGGLFIPTFQMPKIFQKLAFITPHAWALKGYQDILVRGYNLNAVLPCVTALFAFAVGFYFLALLKFRFD